MSRPTVLTFATQGAGGNEEARIRELLREFEPEVFAFDRKHKLRSFWKLWRTIRTRRPDLVVMEGSGIAGGLAILLGRWWSGVPYVVSSGDAIGPWVGSAVRILGPLFGWYERVLCWSAAGFIGWTPYLVGRALTFGTPRAVTAAGWAPYTQAATERAAARRRTRAALGIPDDALVIGIAGAIVWNRRYRYCYGAELVQAMARVRRPNVYALIVGDGTGKAILERQAGDRAGKTILFTGRVPQQEIPGYLAAMDLGSLPQSVDKTGSFRFTTKISEYLDAALPVVTGQIPMAYDLDSGWVWRLPGRAPWSEQYVQSLADLLDTVSPAELECRRAAIPSRIPEFDREWQVQRVTAFVRDLLGVSSPVKNPH
jgi:hypothetical protein